MAEQGIQDLQAEPEVQSGEMTPFTFPVSWNVLTEHPGLATDTPVTEIVDNSIATPVSTPNFAVADSLGKWPKYLGATLLLVTIAMVTVKINGRPPASGNQTAVTTTEMGAAGWDSEWVSDPAGSALGRQLTIYRPSISKSDYRLDFTGSIVHQSLGWVFRATDSRNYYVGKLQAAKLGDPLVFTRFAVVRGVEDRHIRMQLPVVSTGRALKVRLESRGSRFTIYLQDQPIDDWQDDRLKAGGVGFLNQRDEWSQVDSVQFSFLHGGMRP